MSTLTLFQTTTAFIGTTTITAIPTNQPTVAVPLTTTFTPASSCFSAQLTQLPSPSGGSLRFDEPVPAPGSTFYECYPPQLMGAYTSLSPASAIYPAMSPIVCPLSWTSFSYVTPSNYIACCPPNFTLEQPTSTALQDRPALGASCYSNLALGSTYTVTEYGSSAPTATTTRVVNSTDEQAYALPLDGWLENSVEVITATPAKSFPGGAIAGIVIGVILFVLCAVGATYYFLIYPRWAYEEHEDHFEKPHGRDYSRFFTIPHFHFKLSKPSLPSLPSFPSLPALSSIQSIRPLRSLSISRLRGRKDGDMGSFASNSPAVWREDRPPPYPRNSSIYANTLFNPVLETSAPSRRPSMHKNRSIHIWQAPPLESAAPPLPPVPPPPARPRRSPSMADIPTDDMSQRVTIIMSGMKEKSGFR